MKNIALLFLILTTINISIAHEDIGDFDKKIITKNIMDKNCDSFQLRYFHVYELIAATSISEDCLKKYYESLVDHNSFNEVHYTIISAIQGEHRNYSLSLFKELIDRFGEINALETLIKYA